MNPSATVIRSLGVLLVGLTVAGCNTTSTMSVAPPSEQQDRLSNSNYAEQLGEKFPVAAVDISQMDPKNIRQQVDYRTDEQPGTLVVDTGNRFVYLVQEGGKALRYGVGVGREGLEFTGRANIAYKREWPRWTPTRNMIAREPDKYQRWARGMEGGATNPLGARAFYLFKDGKDTLFRIHGTNAPETIGEAVSSGCIRMINHDVMDLYRRVPAGAKVVVL
jgi:lipoprotein-anchoring transpeptidase ErfK/SrfK